MVDVRFELTTRSSCPADDASVKCKGSMDLGTEYCYAGVLLALLRLLTQGVRRVLGEM